MSGQSGGGSAKAGRKKEMILEAAAALLCERGYDQISIDTLAKAAGVSKATIYTNFQGKADILRESAILLGRRLCQPLPRSLINDDPRDALVDLALWLQRACTTPEFIGFYRLCVSEARRFSEVGRVGYTCVSDGLIKPCETVFQIFEEKKLLQIPDPKAAAEQFFGAVVGPCLWYQALGAPLPPKLLSEEYVRKTVEIFLRAYQRQSPSDQLVFGRRASP